MPIHLPSPLDGLAAAWGRSDAPVADQNFSRAETWNERGGR